MGSVLIKKAYRKARNKGLFARMSLMSPPPHKLQSDRYSMQVLGKRKQLASRLKALRSSGNRVAAKRLMFAAKVREARKLVSHGLEGFARQKPAIMRATSKFNKRTRTERQREASRRNLRKARSGRRSRRKY